MKRTYSPSSHAMLPYGNVLSVFAALLAIVAIGFNAGADPLDWPQWQYNAARDAAQKPVQLPDPGTGTLHLQWMRELPEPQRAWPFQWDHRGKLDFDVSYSPVVMGERIFVPSNVHDSVTAYSTEDGSMLWRFYTDGPVRLAPAAYNNRVYFVSDDGHLYCVAAATGTLAWKFYGGPTDQRLLGNERVISFWGARGGPVIHNGLIYFTAGFWPLHGIFVYALDAQTGTVLWVNDTTSSDYVDLPHGGASGYGGLAPQGYLAVNASTNRLVVSCGRNMPAFLNLNTGAVVSTNFRQKPAGGYAVHEDGQGYKNNPRLTAWANQLESQVDGDVFNVLAAHSQLFITTTTGRLYCYGETPVSAEHHVLETTPITPDTDDWGQVAQDMLDALGESEGYALVLGAGSGDLMRELVLRSDLHVVVVEDTPATVQSLREELVDANMYGTRAAIIEAAPASFAMQPYLFSIVASENAEAAGITADETVWASILDWLMPYKGIARIAASAPAAMTAAATAADVDQVTVENIGDAVSAQRGGPLTDAGQWTHQLHDGANTLISEDERVRTPMGLLWFGGPNNHDILPRHAAGPRPQIADGRQVYLGVETIAARCVYSGRRLWIQDFPGIGHPFTNLSLEASWANGNEVYMNNIPGATYIGSPFVTLPDSIYLRYEGDIYQLDPITGATLNTFSLPGQPVTPDWGHMAVQGDYLVTTSEPHIFEDQELGWTNSYSGTSSMMLMVLNRHTGAVLWTRTADIGFRHNAIINANGTVYVIDGLSENALAHMKRRGKSPEEMSKVMALDIETGNVIWDNDSNVFGTFLLYSQEHDILVEGGSQDLRHRLSDEPRNITARDGSTGAFLWERHDHFLLPGAVLGDMLIPGRPGVARSLLTGEPWQRIQMHSGATTDWSYARQYGCNTLSASPNLLAYRSGYAGFFDLQHDSGTGTFSGFRSGCTANMIAADGVLNALDYTRTCTCSYQNQTSLALVHMPADPHIEHWTRYDAAKPDSLGYGINFGAPGRRVDTVSGRVWHNESGTTRRHASAITDAGDSIAWVASSYREMTDAFTVESLFPTDYTVRLHFAEHNPDVQVGERVFDILIDGVPVLTDYDIVADVGGAFIGTVKTFEISTASTMTIELQQSAASPLTPIISGIEVYCEEIPMAEVPDIMGQHLDDAISTLEGAGFAVGNITYVQSDEPDHERILGQEPGAGETTIAGRPIDITVGYAFVTPIFVVPDGAGDQDGSSWENAFSQADLQTAINMAGAAGPIQPVWVAGGLYNPGATISWPTNAEAYGGFHVGDTDISQRDVTGNPSVITGANSRRVIISDVGATNIRIDGFTVANGRTSGGSGAGIRLRGLDATNTIINCRIENCVAGNEGGGLLAEQGCDGVIIENCVFYNNEILRTTDHGAGLAVRSGGNNSVTVRDCVFENNVAPYGSDDNARGGGMAVRESPNTIIERCVFKNNRARRGGGLYIHASKTVVLECLFEGNHAFNGGGAQLTDGGTTGTIERSRFFQNTCEWDGAGVDIRSGAHISLINCILAENSTPHNGGALSVIGGSTTTASATLINCTLHNNFAGSETSPNAIVVWAPDSAGTAQSILQNSIVWALDNRVQFSSGNTLSYSCYSNGAGMTDGGNNVSADPLFVNPGARNFHVLEGSPCLNAGTTENAPATDMVGTARPQDTGVDMGVYEHYMVVVPNVVDEEDWLGLETAQAILEAAGLTVDHIIWVYSDDIPEGSVMVQSPPPGTETLVGGAVILTVSRGEEPDLPVAGILYVSFMAIMLAGIALQRKRGGRKQQVN